MFPIIIPSTLGKRQTPQPPKISTIENYTHLEKKVFRNHFEENLRTKAIGLFETADLIKAFYNFDRESEKNKRMVVDFVEDPDYGTWKYFFRRLFNCK